MSVQNFMSSFSSRARATKRQSSTGPTSAEGKPAEAQKQSQSSPTATSPSNQSAPSPFKTSAFSTPIVQDSGWCSESFMLGAGMVIIQPSTHKVVLLYESRLKYWFLPKGRKDIGESLEQAALREAYEESGYRVKFMPLYAFSHAPAPPHDKEARMKKNTEPIFLSTSAWTRRQGLGAGEYLTSWYVGELAADAVREEGTGMADEQNFTTHLLNIQDAMNRLKAYPGPSVEAQVLAYAWEVYHMSLAIDERKERQRLGESQERPKAEAVEM